MIIDAFLDVEQNAGMLSLVHELIYFKLGTLIVTLDLCFDTSLNDLGFHSGL